jgi:hypothetical protein
MGEHSTGTPETSEPKAEAPSPAIPMAEARVQSNLGGEFQERLSHALLDTLSRLVAYPLLGLFVFGLGARWIHGGWIARQDLGGVWVVLEWLQWLLLLPVYALAGLLSGLLFAVARAVLTHTEDTEGLVAETVRWLIGGIEGAWPASGKTINVDEFRQLVRGFLQRERNASRRAFGLFSLVGNVGRLFLRGVLLAVELLLIRDFLGELEEQNKSEVSVGDVVAYVQRRGVDAFAQPFKMQVRWLQVAALALATILLGIPTLLLLAI